MIEIFECACGERLRIEDLAGHRRCPTLVRELKRLVRRLAGDVASWSDGAPCQGRDVAVFFADDFGRSHGRVLEVTDPLLRAKDICAGCPVRRRCLQWAFEIEDEAQTRRVFGVLGGLAGFERQALRDEPDRLERGEAVFEVQVSLYNLGRVKRRPEVDVVA